MGAAKLTLLALALVPCTSQMADGVMPHDKPPVRATGRVEIQYCMS